MMSTIKKWLLNEWVEQPLEQQVRELGEWFQSPCGQALLQEEQSTLDRFVPSLFGYHLLQMSVHQEVDLARLSPIHHRFKTVAGTQPGSGKHLYASFEELPFESDSIDVIVLHHILEFSPNPHQILKEVNRVLIPRGHVIIVGFNPFSLFGIWKSFASLLTKNPPWRYNSITKWRLLDWFKFLDLNKIQTGEVFYRLPFSSPLLLDKFNFLERIGKRLHLPTGGAFIMMARKDVNAVTPIKPSLRIHLPKTLASFSPRPAQQGASNVLGHQNNHKLH